MKIDDVSVALVSVRKDERVMTQVVRCEKLANIYVESSPEAQIRQARHKAREG